MTNKNVNFFAVLVEENKPKVNRKLLLKSTIITAIVLLSFGIMAFFLVVNMSYKKSTDVIKTYLESEFVATAVAIQNKIESEIAVAKDDIVVYNDFLNGSTNSDGFKAEVFQKIRSTAPEGIGITSFTYEECVFTLNCTAPNDSPAADFAKALENTEDFDYVDYKGFTDGENGITFVISCKVKSDIGGATK